jgi:hypothetical protein
MEANACWVDIERAILSNFLFGEASEPFDLVVASLANQITIKWQNACQLRVLGI